MIPGRDGKGNRKRADGLEGQNMSKVTQDKELIQEIVNQVAKMSIEEIKQDLEMMEMEEVADKLKCGRSTAYHLVNEGKLPAVKFGTLVRIRTRALYALILVKEKAGLAAA